MRDSWTFDPEVQFLASRGYAVLQPNFRGSTGYGRDFVERGYGQFGAGMIDDIDDGVDWLVEQGIVDPARVCIMGASYGGYAAIWAAMRSPERYRCAISCAGPTDLRGMLALRSPLLRRPPLLRASWRRRLEGEERADLDAVSPLRQPARAARAAADRSWRARPRVPVDQSRDLVRALERARTAQCRIRSSIPKPATASPTLRIGRFHAPRRGLPGPPQSGRRSPRAAPARDERGGLPIRRSG